MNITGYGQYSKQVAGIRDPQKIMNSQHKLIFIYPMLFADKIRVQSTQQFDTLMRDFISVTFLSDIFIQNTFNVIGLANQIRPLWDENRQAIDPSVGIIKALNQQGIYTSGPLAPNYPVGPEHTHAIQQKITEKTAVIQQLLKSDPKMAKTRPFIEIITLGNMIEVPVIVGTAPYPVDTLTLMYVLIAAIGLGKKLDNEADLEVIFHELETMNETKYWTLLDNLVKSRKETGDLADWFREKTLSGVSFRGHTVVPGLKKVSGWGRNLPTISRTAGNMASKVQNRINNPPELNQQKQILAPLMLNKSDLDQTKLYFKFVLNSNFAESRLGIDVSNEATKRANISQAKFQGETNKIKNIVIGNFSELIGSIGSSLLTSVANLISTNISSINVSEQKSQNIDSNMVDEIVPQLEQILGAINEGLRGSSVEESGNKIEILKDLCKVVSAVHLFDFIGKAGETSIISDDFDFDSYKRFISYFDQFSNMSDSMSVKLVNEIKFITSLQEQSVMLIHFDNLQKTISKAITEFFKPFKEELSATPDSRLAQVIGSDNSQIENRIIPKFISGLTKIFYFILLTQLQEAMCKFILTVDSDLEMASNEVTAWPNYTLTLPVEIVLALHAAIMGTSWDHMLKGGQQGKELTKDNTPLTNEQVSTRSMFNLNETYVKGVVKFICNRLNVPNLIVVDSKRGDIYYKLMNQSDVNRTRIATIETFIQSKLNRQMTQPY